MAHVSVLMQAMYASGGMSCTCLPLKNTYARHVEKYNNFYFLGDHRLGNSCIVRLSVS